MENKQTIQSIFNLWFWNFQNPTLQQFSNLYHSTVAVIKFFNVNKKYDEKLVYLDSLFFKPIEVLKDKYQDMKITKHHLEWNVSQIEWCYYRDTKLRSKLSTEYYVDSRKVQENKKLTLGEIITVLSLFKLELFKEVVQILYDQKINVFISLPNMGNIEQVRDDQVA